VHKARNVVEARGFEEAESAQEIGLDHRLGRNDAAVDVRFGGEMHDGVGLGLGDQRATAAWSAISPCTNR